MAKKRRFESGSDDLEQLEGIEIQQQCSRKSRRKRQSEADPQSGETGPLIDRIDKSKRRVKNRLARLKDFKDAIREFGS